MQSGKRVRIKSAPDRIGVLTDDVQSIGGRNRWLVQFPDGKQRLPESNLELVDEVESTESLLSSNNFGSVSNLRGAITHARLTGKLADVIYSMESTNTEFYAYQFKPVLNFLSSPSNGILIADEVGLGKTIEAGLIWTELRARENAKRLLIICPAVLRHKWAAELSHRFGIRAEICDSVDVLNRLKDTSRANESFALVASVQGLRPSKNWDDTSVDTNSAKLARYIEEESCTKELFDCVIVDEAHYMRNSESQTHKLAQIIRPATKNIVLLSATPIQLKSEDLFNLLNIIDNENFEYKTAFDNVLRANEPIMELASILRSGECLLSDFEIAISKCLGHPLLSENLQLLDLHNSPPNQKELDTVDFRVRLANRIERINLLGSVVNRTRKRDVKQHRVIREPQAPQIIMSAIERQFYDAVTERVQQYCEKYDQFEGFLLTIPQRQMCSSMPAALRAWQKRVGFIDDDILSDTLGIDGEAVEYEQSIKKQATAGPLISELASLAREVGNYETLKNNDTKYNSLITTLKEYWKSNGSSKIVLFSFYRETLRYLAERLSEDGINAQILMGGMGDVKDQIVEDFKEKEEIQILLTSEVLSEGVDLQFSSTLINYDLPWNPMRVEQRIGRIDRIGQKADKILILNLFYEDTIDDRIYNRLFKRLDIFTQALGDLESLLGPKIRTLTYDLLRHDLTKEQEQQRIEQTASAIANEKQNQEELETEAAGLAAHGDYVLNKVSAAKEMRRYIDGENLWVYVRDFLKRSYKGSSLVEKDTLSIEIDLSSEAKNDLKHFLEASRDSNPTVLAYNAMGKPVTCKFYNNVDLSKKDYEVINQYHPLVQFAAKNTDPDSFHRVVATKFDKSKLPELKGGRYIVHVKRWSTTGAKTEEKLVYRAVDLATSKVMSNDISERIIMTAISHGQDWLEAKSELQSVNLIEQYHKLEMLLDDEFDEYRKQMQLENEDRINLAITTLNGQFDRQIDYKRKSINTLIEKGKQKMIKLFEGQIKSLETTRENRILDYKQRRKISNEPSDVILGVFCVE